MKKKILIIGNGANAYALAKKLSDKYEIHITPSSDTLKEFCTTLDIRENSVNDLLEYVLENDIDMTIPVSQVSISAGISDLFNKHSQQIFAPSNNACEVAVNKVLAKKILYKLHVPTPKFGIFEKENMALDYLKNQKIPFVIKTNDSNSAVIFTSLQSAKTIINSIYLEKNKKLIIEDYIYGTPFSFYTMTDGYKALPIGSSLNYKYSLDGDGGQITGGMASCVPNYKLSFDDECMLMNNVIYPTLTYLENGGNPYLGVLGVNGIKTEDGSIYILGWNSFMNDSDCAAVLNSICDDVYAIIEACVNGSFSDDINAINVNDEYYVSLVLKNTKRETKENPIYGIDNLNEDSIITYFPKVNKNRYLEYNAPTGQVLVITSGGATASTAAERAYDEASGINFEGLSYRKDICRVAMFS